MSKFVYVGKVTLVNGKQTSNKPKAKKDAAGDEQEGGGSPRAGDVGDDSAAAGGDADGGGGGGPPDASANSSYDGQKVVDRGRVGRVTPVPGGSWYSFFCSEVAQLRSREELCNSAVGLRSREELHNSNLDEKLHKGSCTALV